MTFFQHPAAFQEAQRRIQYARETEATLLDLSNLRLRVLPPLEGLRQIASLDLSGSDALASLSGLEALTQLTSLDLGWCSATSLSGLEGLTHLTSLDLSVCDALTSLSGLEGLTQLTSLDLSGCDALTSLSGLEGLTQLTSLNLSGCDALTSLSGLEALTQLTSLTSLNLSGCDALTSLSGLEALTQLTSLNVSGCKVLTSLSGLEALTQLTSLNLWFCDALTSLSGLSGLEALTHLTSLNVSHCDALASLNGLEALTQLTSLNVSHCDALASLNGLEALTQLTSLNVSHCDALASLNGLEALTHLTSLDVSKCNVLTSLNGLEALTQLTSLNLWLCDALTSLSGLSGLEALTHLTSLNVSHCDALASLNGLEALTQLTSLNVSHCDALASLNGLEALTQLTSLNVSHCDALASLNGLEALTHLTSLDVSECKVLTSLSGLEALTQLTWLDLSGCGALTSLSGLEALTQLTWLDLSGCGALTSLSGLEALTQLTSLNVSHCDALASLNGLEALTHLTSLDVSECKVLTSLSGLEALTHLTSLDVSECKVLTSLSGLEALTQLTWLDLSGCGALTSLSGFEALTQLTSLTVSHCDALTSLSGLEALTHLTSLYLNGCNALLDYVGLDQLHNLEVLQIDARYYHQKNQHSDPSRVPWSIMKNLLLNMPQLSLSGSINMEYVPAELTHPIDQTALEDWYFEIEQQGYSNPKTLKVMLLGNGQIGKTQLVRRLRGKSFDESIPSTHGIQIHHFTPDGEDFEIKSWDFGGQDVYLGTHSLFIDNRALYLLLWHPDYENNNLVLDEQLTIRNRPLSYWLAYLKSLAGANVQVLVCQSQCDNPGDDRRAPIPHPVPLDALRETVISNKTPDGLSAFTPLFKRAVAHQLDRNGVVWIPNSWFAVEEAIQELCTQQKLLHYSDYLALCDKHHVAAPGTLANYLHQAGVVFYRKHHFDNQLILDQAWALQGIYLLLERKEALPLLSASNGKFTRDTIEQLLWRYESEYSKQDKSLFLEMMQQCGVCFKVDDDDYIAPDALPDKAYKETDIEQIWQDTDAEHHVRLHYDFLHDSTMRYLLSKIGEKAKAAACYWRYGCCYYDAKSQSKVWFDSTLLTDKEKIETGTFENYGQPGFIDIKTAGRNAEKLICHLLDSIKGVQHLEQKSRIEWQKGQPDSSQKHKGLSPESELTPFGALEPASLPPSTRSAVYFSYAWGEDTDERQQTCDQIYNKLSEENELNIYRDKNATKPGDSIAAFERKIGQADFVLLIMSEKSLYSVHCMNELRLIYERSQQQQSDFVGRVIPVVLSDAKISTRIDKFKVVEHWVSQGQELEDLINKVGLEAAGAESANERQMIRSISNCTMNALTWIGDLITERQPELQVDATIELLKKRIEEQKNRKN